MRRFSFGRWSGKTSEILKRYKEHGGQIFDPKATPHTDAPGAYRSITDNSNARATYSISEYQDWIESPDQVSELLDTIHHSRRSIPQALTGRNGSGEFTPYPYMPDRIIHTCNNMRKSDAHKTCENKPVVWSHKQRTMGLAYCKECILLYWQDCERRGDAQRAMFYDSDGNPIDRL